MKIVSNSNGVNFNRLETALWRDMLCFKLQRSKF